MKSIYKLAIGILCSIVFCHNSMAKDNVPSWIASPQKDCDKIYFCAVGMGRSLKQANADARNAIGKIFSTQIKSSFSTSTTQINDVDTSKIRDFISEKNDILLRKVEIDQNYTDGNEYYSLALLNKADAAGLIEEDIAEIDDKMEALIEDSAPSSAKKLEKLYEQRRYLNQQYQILTSTIIPESISYDEIFKNRKAKTAQEPLFLEVKSPHKAQVANVVKKSFKEHGYSFATSASNNGKKLIVEIEAQEVPFNIDGMVKFEYFVSLKTTRNGREEEIFDTSFEETGLNEKQAFSTAMETLTQQINENISDIDL